MQGIDYIYFCFSSVSPGFFDLPQHDPVTPRSAIPEEEKKLRAQLIISTTSVCLLLQHNVHVVIRTCEFSFLSDPRTKPTANIGIRETETHQFRTCVILIIAADHD